MKTNYGLDAKASDYIYKHHITRLEDIYVNHKTEYKNPPQLLFMSPVSQLYGVNGKTQLLYMLQKTTLGIINSSSAFI